MDILGKDLRHGFRALRNQPSFSLMAILTLALGIGASTAIFSIVDAVILRPLPYANPDQLVMVKERIPKAIPTPIPVCAPDAVQFQRESKAFQSMAAFAGGDGELSGGTKPQRLRVERVNATLFTTLGVQPSLGRGFTAEDDQPGRHVAILSYGLWQRQFGGDQNILGRTVNLDRNSYEVVGVMPRSFVFPFAGMNEGDPAAIFVPMTFTKKEMAAVGDNFDYGLVGRLKEGVSTTLASADVEAIARRIQQSYPPQFQAEIDLGAVALPLREQVVGKSKELLLLLLGAVLFVLLISCINVANLLLARATDRQREIAVRLAMGASKGRLLRQLLVESLMLTLSAAGLGLAFAYWATDALVALMPADIPRVHAIALNGFVVAFAVCAAVLIGVIFGVVPALAASRINVNETLKESGRTGTATAGRHRMRGALVITEIALAMILLVGAGLLLRSFQRVLETDPGFQPQHVLTASLSLPETQYKENAQVRGFYEKLLARLEQLPGAVAVGASSDLPMNAGWDHIFSAEGYQPPPGAKLAISNHSVILGNYLQALGVPLIRGRYFTDQDTEKSTPVLLVSESLAKRYFPNQDPLGKRLKWGPAEVTGTWRTIVGVVGDVKQGPLDVETTPHTYQPFAQQTMGSMNAAVRATGNPASLSSALQSAIWSMDPQLAVAKVQTMDQVISTSTTPRRFNLMLLGGFAGLALLLSAIGIYGVIAYSVAQRVHEIGIRMALGAQRQDVLRMVLAQGLRLLGIGLVLGASGGLLLTRSLESLLYEVRPSDPVTYACAIAILAAVALLASYVPARRATKVDPMTSLRYE
ncbi:MAG TPA: ABC transporter permease [Terriglobales bacterium]|nr:ABC transporter permease [Terriglobales bacterium]